MLSKNRTRFIGLLMVVMMAVFAMTTGATNLYADSSWEARYWNNRTLSGDPALQRTESELNHDWGDGSPATTVVSDDNFSARWTRTINLPAGTYRFTATMDDGMRVWVDNALIIDSWTDSQVHSVSADRYLGSGDHQIKVEYYEVGGKAVARLSWVAISGAVPGSEPAITRWRGEYFNNLTLSGTPALVRDDDQINFNWGGSSPAWGTVAADNFSVRWTRNLVLDPGRYRFTVRADDGVRLWVNNRLLIDRWIDEAATTYSAEIDLPGGAIPVRLEYYERVGGAEVSLSHVLVGSGTTGGQWRGEYFNNKNLSGLPVLVRDDASINFNWRGGSPATGINVDDFSARWTRSLYLNPGRYRFTVTADDGVRVWVNGQQIINGWSDHPSQTFSGDIDLPGGTFPIQVEYYESGGGARVELSWTVLSAAPAPTPAPANPAATATVISSRLNVRSGPGTQHNVITVLSKNQVVNLAGYRNAEASWVMVALPNGAQGWVSASYLQSSFPFASLAIWQGQPTSSPPVSGAATATVVRANHLNVRQGPGTQYGIVAIASRGATVTLLGRNAATTWVKIALSNGTQGWVNASYLSTTFPLSTLQVAG
ncbi:MAG TPA: PA14 domain-containing protein [Anaerolineae bacterium]